MRSRRTVLGAAAVLASGFAGCLSTEAPDDQAPERTPDRNSEPVYVLRAAFAYQSDDLEPVLSTDDDAVADFETLYSLIIAVMDEHGTVAEEITAAEAERFKDLTEGLEYHGAGNPPGYYIDHEGTLISVSYDER